MFDLGGSASSEAPVGWRELRRMTALVLLGQGIGRALKNLSQAKGSVAPGDGAAPFTRPTEAAAWQGAPTLLCITSSIVAPPPSPWIGKEGRVEQ